MISPNGTKVVGQKGKSGRKSARYELLKRQVIEKAWDRVNKEINNKEVQVVALPIALKDMVEKKGDAEGNVLPTPILVQFLDGKQITDNQHPG